MKTIAPADAPPANRLGKKPKIKSVDDVDLALHELSWIASRRETVEGAAEQSITLLKQQTAAKLFIDEDSFSDREQVLTAAVEQFAQANRNLFEADGARSRKLTHGVVGFKAKPAKVEFVEGHDSKSVAAKLSDGLPAKIIAFLKRLDLLPWLRLKVELDIAGIGKACKDGAVTSEQLVEHGMTYVAGETVVIEPAKHFVEN